MAGTTEVFIACSLDGFIAGEPDDHGFGAFFARVGALLMGRRTYDVVTGFDEWHYGDKPVLVATTRPLGEPAAPTVRAVSGSPHELLEIAREVAGEGVVYVDGGILIRSFLDAGLIDEMTVSLIPVILGSGIPLFAGTARRTKLEPIEGPPATGGLVQLRYRPLPARS